MFGCASFDTTPIEKQATVHLCYELVAGGQRRSAAIAEELNSRGELCEKYREQISLMAEIDAKKSVALREAILNMSNNLNQNSALYRPYYPEQHFLSMPQTGQSQIPKIVNCNSYRMGNMTNTQCY